MAETTSFPELFLLLRRDAKHKREALRLNALAQVLAAKSVWNEEAAEAASTFIDSLDDSPAPPPEDNTHALIRMFAGFGIPIEET